MSEDRYEAIHLIIKTPKTDKENDSWFDRLFDFITSFCEESGTGIDSCTCGMESMGGSGGTLEQCWDYERITEKWAIDVLADDLKLVLKHVASSGWGPVSTPLSEAYERLRTAAYWHDSFNEWVANLPDDEEEDGSIA